MNEDMNKNKELNDDELDSVSGGITRIVPSGRNISRLDNATGENNVSILGKAKGKAPVSAMDTKKANLSDPVKKTIGDIRTI